MSADLPIAEKCRRIFATAEDKLRHLVTAHPDYLPQYTQKGQMEA